MYVELSCSCTPLCLGASTVGVAPRSSYVDQGKVA